MSNSQLSWKERFVWLAVIAVILLIATATMGWVSKDNQIAAYVNFAGGCVSIALALVAIYYSITYGRDSQKSMQTAKDVLVQASSVMTEKAGLVEQSSQKVDEAATKLLQGRLGQPTAETGQQQEVSHLPMQIKQLSLLSVSMLYALVKANKNSKAIDLKQMAKHITSPTLGLSRQEFYSSGCAFFAVFSWFWNSKHWKGDNVSFSIMELPDGFADVVYKEVEICKQHPKTGQQFQEMVSLIDAYFADAE